MEGNVAHLWGTRGRRGGGRGGPQKPTEPIRHPKNNENGLEKDPDEEMSLKLNILYTT